MQTRKKGEAGNKCNHTIHRNGYDKSTEPRQNKAEYREKIIYVVLKLFQKVQHVHEQKKKNCSITALKFEEKSQKKRYTNEIWQRYKCVRRFSI